MGEYHSKDAKSNTVHNRGLASSKCLGVWTEWALNEKVYTEIRLSIIGDWSRNGT